MRRKMIEVTVYTRPGCHLCEDALEQVETIKSELAGDISFNVKEISITQDPELERKYSDYIPVIHINDEAHDFFRVDRERFISELRKVN
jgi:glutaredoxin